MNPNIKVGVICVAAAVLCVAAFALVPHLRNRSAGVGISEPAEEEIVQNEETDADVTGTKDASAAVSSGRKPIERNASLGKLSRREKGKFDVGEMRREAEDMLRRFRGTPEERQEVIDECEDGKELIRLIAELSESSIEKMSHEELEKERENFEKDYRAQLDFLKTGQLQRMLKTPEEREVIGSTIETVQSFLERVDEALHSAGY
jgi:hypothetical protein